MHFDENEVKKKELNVSKMTLSHSLTCFENNRIVCAKKGKKYQELSKCLCSKYKIHTHKRFPTDNSNENNEELCKTSETEREYDSAHSMLWVASSANLWWALC